jgi:hypothetical protein
VAYHREFNSPPAIIIADTGMLMGEVLQSSRGPRITSLLWSLHRRSAVLILPRHVLEEVERDLPKRATTTDDIELAYQRLRSLYLARARVVDVPAHWAASDPRVQAIERRHPIDKPAAQLAIALGYSYLLTEDPDLHETPGLGISAWLQVTHATATEPEVESLAITVNIPLNVTTEAASTASRAIAKAPTGVKLLLAGLAIAAVGGAIWSVKTGKVKSLLERAEPGLRELARIYGPPLMETLTRYSDGRITLSTAAVAPTETPTFSERIARVLAINTQPLLAGDIARALPGPGNLTDRTRAVREELRRHPGAFHEVTRGRWLLGHPTPYQPAPFPLIEIAQYRERLHQNTRRTA